jgi:hypothetical protein
MMMVMAVRLVVNLAGSLGRLRRHVYPRAGFLENMEDRSYVTTLWPAKTSPTT